jgi:hypothetical protein
MSFAKHLRPTMAVGFGILALTPALPVAAQTVAAASQVRLVGASSSLPDAPDALLAAVSSSASQSTLPAAPASESPAAAPATAAQKHSPSAQEQLEREEHQRILGVVPNFNTVDNSEDILPLTPKQKFSLMWKSSTDPFIFVAAGFVSGIGQARDTNPGFGQGAEGYAKRFGASYADTVDGNLWGNAVLPILFKEDPRYFRLGRGSFTHRFLYSASTAVWSRYDSGKWGPNYANVLGNFISGGISNAYYPAADRGLSQTVSGAVTVTAEGAIGAEFYEFWPDISRHLFHKREQQEPGVPVAPATSAASPAQP